MSRQSATANNLANANTVGFRADISAAQTLWQRGAGLQSRALSSEETLSADMREGAVSQTGRSLDVALQKDALLSVQADNGEEAYTRRGDLKVTETGLLINGDGAPVLGEGGPITVPPHDSISIDAQGRISIVPEGGDPKTPQDLDRLKLVSPAGSNIVKALDGLFRVKGGGALPSDPDAKLVSGALEGSNVNTSQALIDMIESSRAWETQVKMLATAKDIDTDAAQLMRLPD
ncbi:MAG: flagellar basal-body rod protein FlgF [Sphingomonas bacterium]|nr:flagellar basal-body rod protein FlgF [Sphingomonas bacterium]